MLKDIKSFIYYILAIVPSIIVSRKKGPIWILCERINIADDNAWIFYHWLRENHPRINAYFILDKNAHNYSVDDKNMIPWGSIKHYVYYLASDIHIMATFNTPAPNGRVCHYFNKIFHRDIKKIYLKHGIIKDRFDQHSYPIHKFRLFFCGAAPEYESARKTALYPEGYIKYTGLARFDDLLLRKRDDGFILIIPTWRKYIGVDSRKSDFENEKLFLDSPFYKHYSALLSSKDFAQFLEKNNTKAKFCLHAEYRRFEKFFKSDIPRIEVTKISESIHELLLSCSLLITDYSSVFFDAAYAGKPIIYYHFDYREFRQNHLSEGYFSYERDGMGPVVHSEDELIRYLKKINHCGEFYREDEYEKRSASFFPLHDTSNCDRIFREIRAI